MRAKSRFPLHRKITLLVVGALVLLALATGFSNYYYFRGVLRREAMSRGKAIGLTLASALVEMPEAAVASTIGSVKKDAHLAYVEVVDASGTVIQSTFEGRAPAQDPKVLKETERVQETAVDGKAYLDVPALVITGNIVHIGLDPTEGDQAVLSAQRPLIILSLASLLIAALVATLLVKRFIAAPLTRLTEAARQIADGDLTQNVEILTTDEVGELAEAFAKMVNKLKDVLLALQDSVKLLNDAGDELGRSTSAQSDTITRHAAALQETQVTAQEIRQTSVLAAEKAEAVLKLTETAEKISSSGESAIESSLGGLTDIRAQVEDIASKINQLSDRAQQIGGITLTVKDLADQSNMLALNAAIEAARSGEHGKGFAVVAREIRSLADQSIQSTNRVREILEDIGSAMRAAVSITQSGSQKIEGGLTQVKQSGENLRQLSGIVLANSAAVRQIAAAVAQQNAGITQIFSAVSGQSEMMGHTMEQLDKTTQAAMVLKGLSQRVADLIKQFRV